MSSVYADVIVDITNEKLDRTFQYKVPPELTGEIGPGTAVQIPFGNGNRTITGYVLSVGNEPKYPQDRMKAILAVQKDAATVETKLIALAAWMRHTYGSTMIQALKTVLPVKVKARGKETREIALLADPAECEELLENYRKKNYKARIRLLNALLAQPVLPGPVVSKELKITADTLHVMEEQGVLEIRRTSTWRNPVSDAAGRTTAGKPNEQQQAVVDGIRKEWEGQNRPCLIRGVSGGAGVLIGNLLGANELEKAREYGGRLSHLSIAIGIVTGGLLMLISPAIVHFAPLSDTAAEYLQYMLLFCGLNLMAQSVNTTVLDGIFCAGGDAKFDMQGNIGAMWCFSVPLGFLAAFWLKLPVMVVYCIVNLDEIVKLPAVYHHYKKYIWVRNITRDVED